MIRLFCGYDPREAIGFHVFCNSVLELATAPVSLIALDSKGLPQGTNAFTFSRFLVPWLCEFKGHAIFMDAADMLMLGDIAELDALFDPQYAVQVVKHPNYTTRHPRKYVGTTMECANSVYARKNWASVMLINCEHPYWRVLDHQTINSVAGLSLLQFGGLRYDDVHIKDKKKRIVKTLPREIGALPDEWNRLVDEGHPVQGAKVLHWTAGIPGFPAYANAPAADQWFRAHDRMMETA